MEMCRCMCICAHEYVQLYVFVCLRVYACVMLMVFMHV
jgi:hypothetical protein